MTKLKKIVWLAICVLVVIYGTIKITRVTTENRIIRGFQADISFHLQRTVTEQVSVLEHGSRQALLEMAQQYELLYDKYFQMNSLFRTGYSVNSNRWHTLSWYLIETIAGYDFSPDSGVTLTEKQTAFLTEVGELNQKLAEELQQPMNRQMLERTLDFYFEDLNAIFPKK